MNKKLYRISLRTDANNYYSVVNGNVQLSSTPYYLPNAPDGWSDTEVTEARNIKYIGFDRDFSAPYKFVKDGSKIFRSIWYTQGRKGLCRVYVDMLNDTTLQYEPFFDASLNFKTSEDEKYYFQIEILQDGTEAAIKSNEDTTYEIPIDSSSINVQINPSLCQGVCTWLSAYPAPDAGLTGSLYYNLKDNKAVGNPITPNSATRPGPVPGQTDTSGVVQPHLFYVNQPITNVYFKANFNFYVKNGSSLNTTWSISILRYGSGTLLSQTVFASGSLAPNTNTGLLNCNVDTTSSPISMGIGETIRLWVSFGSTSGKIDSKTCTFSWDSGTTFAATYQYYSPAIQFKALRYYQAFQNLAQQITGGKAAGVSQFLLSKQKYYDSIPYNTVIFSGDALRGINSQGQSNPVIKTTLTDFFKSATSRWNLGLDVDDNDNIRIEQREFYFNQYDVIADLGTPSEISITDAEDFFYNSVKVGYQDQTYDEMNGRDEFNTGQEWSLQLDNEKKELDMIDPYRADMQGMVDTYINYLTQDTADSSSDNDTFILQIDDTPVNGYYNATIYPSAQISGIADPNKTSNIALTPKRNLLRNGSFLRSILYGQDNDYITFQTADKNAALDATIDLVTVKEKASVRVGDLAPALFQNKYITVKVAVPRNLLALKKAKPFGVFQFTHYNGQVLYGFPMQVGVKPANRANYTFKLLSAPRNDLSKLIR